jgi:hypothetical protein
LVARGDELGGGSRNGNFLQSILNYTTVSVLIPATTSAVGRLAHQAIVLPYPPKNMREGGCEGRACESEASAHCTRIYTGERVKLGIPNKVARVAIPIPMIAFSAIA